MLLTLEYRVFKHRSRWIMCVLDDDVCRCQPISRRYDVWQEAMLMSAMRIFCDGPKTIREFRVQQDNATHETGTHDPNVWNAVHMQNVLRVIRNSALHGLICRIHHSVLAELRSPIADLHSPCRNEEWIVIFCFCSAHPSIIQRCIVFVLPPTWVVLLPNCIFIFEFSCFCFLSLYSGFLCCHHALVCFAFCCCLTLFLSRCCLFIAFHLICLHRTCFAPDAWTIFYLV